MPRVIQRLYIYQLMGLARPSGGHARQRQPWSLLKLRYSLTSLVPSARSKALDTPPCAPVNRRNAHYEDCFYPILCLQETAVTIPPDRDIRNGEYITSRSHRAMNNDITSLSFLPIASVKLLSTTVSLIGGPGVVSSMDFSRTSRGSIRSKHLPI